MEVSHQQRFSTEEEFERMMDPLPIMVRARDLNGEVRFSNAAWKNFTGIFLEMNIHEDSRSVYEAAFASNTQFQKAFKATYRCSDKHGVYHWLAEQAVPWYSTEGGFLGFICYTMDTDDWMVKEAERGTEALEREQAMNEELEAYNEELSATNEQLQYSQNSLSLANNNLEQILNMLPASVVVIRGHNLVVEMINNSNLTYWNKTKEEVLGKRFLAILPDLANQPFASQLHRVMETGEVISVKESQVLFTNPDGSSRETYVDYTYQPLSDLEGNNTGVLVMSFEITDRVMSRRLLEKYSEKLASANAQLQQRNEELALSEARFKYLIEEAPVAIGILHNRTLVIESANHKLLEVWGKSANVIGMPLGKAIPELQGQPFLDILDEVYNSGKLFSAQEIRVMLEHDSELKEFFFNVTYQPVADFSGATADILVVAVNVTEQVNSRKQVERSEHHFRYLADVVPAKISNALPGGEVTFFNKQWLDYAGMDFNDLKEFGYHNMMHPDEIPALQAGLVQSATTGVPYVSEMRFKNTDGEYIWHLNIASPIFDNEGKLSMWVGSTTNIQTLKEEEQRKSDFVGMLSHELKTPVTSIKGHIQLLLRALEKETPSPLTDRIKPSLSRIDKLLLQLTRLISDMLDLTRIEADRLDLRKQHLMLDTLVAEVVDDFRLSHQHHQFRLRSESDVALWADRDKISQVLINLIANAIKYAPDSVVIDLSLTTVGKEVQIEVKDYGIGIDEKDQQKIFERFYRVEGQNESHYSGFGIGLFLVNSIIARHGGRIKLESTRGKGSTFTVYLPISHE